MSSTLHLLLLAGATLLVLMQGSGAHECSDSCVGVKCPDTAACDHGTIKEHCGCCDVCLRKENEKCGGHEHWDGECEPPLKCVESKCSSE
ncbi:insulin-like growth factor-binding protein 7 [Penaeus japonicus]|uniref:insulin-like growth factor-binding protein 7 n=1 Tax=Penaeus japonicus TaxID=27405 RepID=UPI001C70FF1D|nr:insulin-like growth factor-binding protein 7 [Penaeus japonicus]